MEKLSIDFSNLDFNHLNINCFIQEPHEQICKEYFNEDKYYKVKFCNVKFIYSDGDELRSSYALTICLQRAIDKYGYNKPIPYDVFNKYVKGEIK